MGGRAHIRRASAVAGRQRGLLTRAQLLNAGVTRRAIDGLVAAGWLTRVHEGVYAIGPPRRDPETYWLAATLATGGVLSHRSAAELWGLLEPRAVVHVARERQGRPAGIVVHRGRLGPDAVTRRAGIPCTTLVRTLIDASGRARRDEVARMFDQAQVLHRLRPAVLGAALVAERGRRGVARLATLLSDAVDPGEIESLLELRFLALCRQTGLPRPVTQVPFGPYRADFVFAAARVAVETDGGRWHATAARRARDARKAALIQAQGYALVRVTWRELHDDPHAVADRIRRAERDQIPRRGG